MDSRFTVEFTEDSISINYDGIESLYWTKDEWKDDPEVVFSIANAIYLSQRFPEELLKSGTCHHETVKKKKVNNV